MKLFAFPTLVLLIVLASGATASINVFKRAATAVCTAVQKNTCGDADTCRAKAQNFCDIQSKCGVCSSQCTTVCTGIDNYPKCNDCFY